jgi:hypothetical protein
MGRALAAILGIALAANGLTLLFAGLWWFGATPGVTATGPYNPHFVRDIGAAYLVSGAGLAVFAIRPSQARLALQGAAAFLTLHAAIHVFDAVCGARPLAAFVRDFAGVYLPALVTLALCARKAV